MARGRAGFLKQKSQSDEALELQKQAKKAGLLGSLGSMLGSFALMPLLGPGASVAMKSLMAGLGSTLGNVTARKLGGGKIEKEGLWYKGQREELAKGLNTGAITQGITSGMLAGLTPWLKGGMKDPLFKGGMDVAGAKAARLAKFVTPATEGATSALTEGGSKLLENNPAKLMRKVGLTKDTAHLWKTPVTDASAIMKEAPLKIDKIAPTAGKISAESAKISADAGIRNLPTKSLTDDLMDLFKQQDETFLG